MTEYIIDLPFAWIYNEADGTKRESIVRCRDCKHAISEGAACMYFGTGEWGDTPSDVEPDGFCAWGEAR